MPSTPAWRCLSTPDPGHEPCEAETPRQSPLLCHGALSPSPCFWAPPSARDRGCSAAPHPSRFGVCLAHLFSPGKKKRESSAHRPGLDPPLGSDLHHLPPWFPGPQPAPASPLSALSGAAPGLHPRRRRPPSAPRGPPRPQGAPACPVWNTRPCPPTQGPHSGPSRLPSGSGRPVSGTAAGSLRTP